MVKDYLSMVREEQLRARISPTQAQPFFIADLLAFSAYIAKRLIDRYISSKELYTFARDQADSKTLFFAGDRAGDLGKMKLKKCFIFHAKKVYCLIILLPNLLVMIHPICFHPNAIVKICLFVQLRLIETYIAICDDLKLPVRHGFLFRSLSPQGFVQPLPFDSSAAQARLKFYVGKLPHVVEHRKITLHGLRNGALFLWRWLAEIFRRLWIT